MRRVVEARFGSRFRDPRIYEEVPDQATRYYKEELPGGAFA